MPPKYVIALILYLLWFCHHSLIVTTQAQERTFVHLITLTLVGVHLILLSSITESHVRLRRTTPRCPTVSVISGYQCVQTTNIQTSLDYDLYWFMTFVKCTWMTPMIQSKEWHQERARQVLQGVCKQRWRLFNLHSLNESESPCKIKVFCNVILHRCSWHHDFLSNSVSEIKDNQWI